MQALATVGSLLGVEEEVLEKMLTQRVVKTRGEVFEKKLELQDANLTRDAIVKSLYEVGTVGRGRMSFGRPARFRPVTTRGESFCQEVFFQDPRRSSPMSWLRSTHCSRGSKSDGLNAWGMLRYSVLHETAAVHVLALYVCSPSWSLENRTVGNKWQRGAIRSILHPTVG